MPDLLVSHLIKPFLIGLILFPLLHPMGFEQRNGGVVFAESLEKNPSVDSHETPPKKESEESIITDMSITNGTTKRLVKDKKIQAKNAPDNIRIYPPTIDIIVLGPPFDLAQNKGLQNDISAYINTEGLTPGIYVRPARIILPEEYVMVDANPEIFVIEIQPNENSK